MKPTPAMRRALQSAVDHGNPTHHLRGQAEWGGWGGTREALIRRGWLTTSSEITDAGRAAIGLNLPKPGEPNGTA